MNNTPALSEIIRGNASTTTVIERPMRCITCITQTTFTEIEFQFQPNEAEEDVDPMVCQPLMQFRDVKRIVLDVDAGGQVYVEYVA